MVLGLKHKIKKKSVRVQRTKSNRTPRYSPSSMLFRVRLEVQSRNIGLGSIGSCLPASESTQAYELYGSRAARKQSQCVKADRKLYLLNQLYKLSVSLKSALKYNPSYLVRKCFLFSQWKAVPLQRKSFQVVSVLCPSKLFRSFFPPFLTQLKRFAQSVIGMYVLQGLFQAVSWKLIKNLSLYSASKQLITKPLNQQKYGKCKKKVINQLAFQPVSLALFTRARGIKVARLKSEEGRNHWCQFSGERVTLPGAILSNPLVIGVVVQPSKPLTRIGVLRLEALPYPIILSPAYVPTSSKQLTFQYCSKQVLESALGDREGDHT